MGARAGAGAGSKDRAERETTMAFIDDLRKLEPKPASDPYWNSKRIINEYLDSIKSACEGRKLAGAESFEGYLDFGSMGDSTGCDILRFTVVWAQPGWIPPCGKYEEYDTTHNFTGALPEGEHHTFILDGIRRGLRDLGFEHPIVEKRTVHNRHEPGTLLGKAWCALYKFLTGTTLGEYSYEVYYVEVHW